MQVEPIRCEIQDGQALLTIDREGARNALSGEAVTALTAALERVEADPNVRVVILTGAGQKVFCAGGDLSGMVGDGFLAAHAQRRAYAALLKRLSSLAKPTIARVNGHALAGGLGLLLACDLAVCVDQAQLGTPEVDVGLFPMMVMALLQRHVGRKQALELVMTGQKISAQRAEALGLVNRVVPAAELDAEVASLARTLAQKSSAVLGLGKRAFLCAEGLPFDAALELLATQLSINTLAEDAAEGVGAFLEKRRPVWKDR
jgi:enoyl-CoA hydratase/carnithine racemase